MTAFWPSRRSERYTARRETSAHGAGVTLIVRISLWIRFCSRPRNTVLEFSATFRVMPPSTSNSARLSKENTIELTSCRTRSGVTLSPEAASKPLAKDCMNSFMSAASTDVTLTNFSRAASASTSSNRSVDFSASPPSGFSAGFVTCLKSPAFIPVFCATASTPERINVNRGGILGAHFHQLRHQLIEQRARRGPAIELLRKSARRVAHCCLGLIEIVDAQR